MWQPACQGIYGTGHSLPHVRTALFLGAGASVFAGQPTTGELMERVRKRVREREDMKRSEDRQNYIMRVINNDVYSDIEKLYDGIEQIIGIDKNPNCKPIIGESDTDHGKIIDEMTGLRSTIREVLLDSFSIDPRLQGKIKQLYRSVWEMMKNRGTDKFQVFTTNYDTVMEEYCTAANLELVNGFMPYRYLSRYWFSVWTAETANPVYLTKLHGSINWHRDNDDEIVEIGGVEPRSADRDILIVPTEGAKRYDWGPFPDLMDRFRKEIENVDVLLVIGFSYRDDEIVRIIRNRLENGMALISVSPDAAVDIRRVHDAKYRTERVGDQYLKVIDGRIFLCEEEFGPDTIAAVLFTLEAAYKLRQQYGPRRGPLHQAQGAA